MIIASPLPETFWIKANPVPVKAPQFVAVNSALAERLDFKGDFFSKPEALAGLSGNAPFENFESVSLAYSGHQFGHWNPLMGDGRAHLIATLSNGSELHLKGSGATPFSKNGDGRAALGPMLREYIISEAFAGLGIATTRTLSVVSTGELVCRRRKEPGGVAARIAKSHVRVGTFQYAAAHLGPTGVQSLYEHERARCHPAATSPQQFLSAVLTAQAKLIAQWMCVGFIHGVMNTDNMTTSGETIDFGPCAFMDQFHPQKVFSSIDERGRYAWDKQPTIAHWNLTRLAESLLPLLSGNQDEAIKIAQIELDKFAPQFENAFEVGMLKKFGLTERRHDDGKFIADMLRTLMEEELDFTLFFRNITNGEVVSAAAHEIWKTRLNGREPDFILMKANNPIYIARNHQVEAALNEAEKGNLTRLNHLCALLKTPFTEQPNSSLFEAPPMPEEEVTQTFCGT